MIRGVSPHWKKTSPGPVNGCCACGGSLGCNRTTTVDIYGRTMEHTDENTLTKS